jgi:hypothetical protein
LKDGLLLDVQFTDVIEDFPILFKFTEKSGSVKFGVSSGEGNPWSISMGFYYMNG